jgi:small subunit ribosomal protein S33
MASVAPSRLAALARLRSTIFQTSYNPTSQRTGAKYLKRRLRGPSMIEYYPNQLSIATLNKEFPGLDLVDEYEEQRLQDVVDKKKRGKGAPKKAKSAGTFIVYISISHRLIILRQLTVAAHKESDRSVLIVMVFTPVHIFSQPSTYGRIIFPPCLRYFHLHQPHLPPYQPHLRLGSPQLYSNSEDVPTTLPRRLPCPVQARAAW